MSLNYIDTILSKQKVLTSNGQQSVNEIISKLYDGDLIGIRVYGYPHPLMITPDHLLLTSSGWKEAKELHVGDWMIYPIPHGETSLDELRLLIPSPPKSRAKRHTAMTGSKNRVSKELLETMLSSGKTYQQIANELGYKTKQAIWEYASLYGLSRPVDHAIIGDPVSDDDFWRVVGYWMAEGSLSSGRKGGARNVIRFTFSLSEQHLANDIHNVLLRYGIMTTQQIRKDSLLVHFSSQQIGEFLSLFGIGAKNKYLPEWAILLPIQFARELVRGYIEGDGTEKDGWERITCSSLSLLIGFQRLLLRLNVVSSIMAGIGKYELRFTLSSAPWLNFPGREVNGRFSKIDRDRLLVRIKSIEIDHYEGLVYDLRVSNPDLLGYGMTIHS